MYIYIYTHVEKLKRDSLSSFHTRKNYIKSSRTAQSDRRPRKRLRPLSSPLCEAACRAAMFQPSDSISGINLFSTGVKYSIAENTREQRTGERLVCGRVERGGEGEREKERERERKEQGCMAYIYIYTECQDFHEYTKLSPSTTRKYVCSSFFLPPPSLGCVGAASVGNVNEAERERERSRRCPRGAFLPSWSGQLGRNDPSFATVV